MANHSKKESHERKRRRRSADKRVSYRAASNGCGSASFAPPPSFPLPLAGEGQGGGGRARLSAPHRGSGLGDLTPPLSSGPRFLTSDANGLEALSDASAASTSQTGHDAGRDDARSRPGADRNSARGHRTRSVFREYLRKSSLGERDSGVVTEMVTSVKRSSRNLRRPKYRHTQLSPAPPVGTHGAPVIMKRIILAARAQSAAPCDGPARTVTRRYGCGWSSITRLLSFRPACAFKVSGCGWSSITRLLSSDDRLTKIAKRCGWSSITRLLSSISTCAGQPCGCGWSSITRLLSFGLESLMLGEELRLVLNHQTAKLISVML